MSFPSRLLGSRPGDHHAIVRLQPVLDVERRIKNRLKLIVVFLSDRLELVVMTLGTLEREPQERRADDLNGSLQHGVLVRAHLVGVAVALTGAVLAIAQEMGRDELIDDRLGRFRSWSLAGQLIAGQLFAHDLVERTIGIERANDIISVSIGQRPVAVGAEVSVGIRVTRRFQPVFAPALAVVRRGQQAFDKPLVGTRIGVVDERGDLVGAWRNSRQVEAQTANQGDAIGVRTEGQSLVLRAPSE